MTPEERRQNNTENGKIETPEDCDHQWANKAGAGYRVTPVAICVKCGEKL